MNDQEFIEIQDTMKEYFPKLVESSLSIANFIRVGNWNDATQLMVPHMEGLKWFQEVLTHLHDLKKVNVMHDLVSLAEVLRELTDALERKDTVVIADIYEYELLPLIEVLGEQVTLA